MTSCSFLFNLNSSFVLLNFTQWTAELNNKGHTSHYSVAIQKKPGKWLEHTKKIHRKTLYHIDTKSVFGKMTVTMDLPCLTFFLSLGGSFRALMTRAAADGTTDTLAWRFWMVSWTVIFRPFQSAVALAMSSPIFLGERPKGPTLGARDEVAPTSPPTALSFTGKKEKCTLGKVCHK